MKNNFTTKYCHNCTFLEGVPFEQHGEFQIIFSLWDQFSEPVAKSIFVIFTIIEFLKLPYINFDTYFFPIINQQF